MEEVPKAQIKIIGTSHIAAQSVREIEKAFSEFQPDIIAIELDKRRLQSLQERAAGAKDQRLPISMIKQIGATGYVFAVVGRAVQKKMGNVVQVEPGVDMLTGVNLAALHNKPLELVDQDVLITMKRLSKQFTFKEKMRVVADIAKSPFSKEMKRINIDLKKVPDDKTIDFLMDLLKKRYPSLHNVLIIERNIVMAANLDRIVRKNPGKKILLIIGAGHGDDLKQRLRNLDHLAELL
jgi:pheromone shutdown protein TraB